MARMLVTQLYDPLAQIRVSYFNAALFEVRIESAFLRKHRFALYHLRHTMPRENARDDCVVLSSVACPVDLRAQLRGRGLELLEILIELRHRVQLDLRCQIAKRFPLRHRLRSAIAFAARAPDGRIVPTNLLR